MITRDQAGQIAARLAGAPASDPGKGWGLEESDAGWLVTDKRDEPLMGAASYFIERATGRVMGFPSYIPPRRILEEYDDVVADGFPVEPA